VAYDDENQCVVRVLATDPVQHPERGCRLRAVPGGHIEDGIDVVTPDTDLECAHWKARSSSVVPGKGNDVARAARVNDERDAAVQLGARIVRGGARHHEPVRGLAVTDRADLVRR